MINVNNNKIRKSGKSCHYHSHDWFLTIMCQAFLITEINVIFYHGILSWNFTTKAGGRRKTQLQNAREGNYQLPG